MDHVILVDESDRQVGTMEKMEAHRKGILHRAFSVLLFNASGQLLLQKRSPLKYHSGGLWANTCCSHPQPSENIEDTVSSKLFHEMGVKARPEFAYKFIYRADLDNDLIEHELDHVFVGTVESEPVINPAEVADWRLCTIAQVRKDMKARPEDYAYWFRLIAWHPQLDSYLGA